jgi:hypothetical protein
VPHERSPDVTPRSSPTPATAHRHDFFENPNPGLVDLKTATPEEQRMLALILGTLRVRPLELAEVLILTGSFHRRMDHPSLKPRWIIGASSERVYMLEDLAGKLSKKVPVLLI